MLNFGLTIYGYGFKILSISNSLLMFIALGDLHNCFTLVLKSKIVIVYPDDIEE